MKNQNLYLVAGALLASTALSTASYAAGLTSANAAGEAVEDYEAPVLATQMFPEDEDDHADVSIDSFAVSLTLDSDITSDFVVALRPVGADFSAIAAATSLFGLDAGNSLTALTDSECTTTRGDSLIVLTCNADLTATGPDAIAAVVLNGLELDDAGVLAQAEGEVTISGSVTVNDFTFDELEATALITSDSGAEITVDADQVTIDAEGDPQFAFIDGGTEATIATVEVDVNADVVGTSLTALATADIFGATDFVVDAPVLAGEGVVSVTIEDDAGNVEDTVLAEDFDEDDGTATASVAAAQINDTFSVIVNFDGETAIEESDAGTLTITPAAGAVVTEAVAEVEAATAALVRGGLNVSLNYLLASGGGFSSYARITNTGTDPAPVTITLIDAATGEELGDSFDTDDVEPGATLQLSAAEIEEGAGVTVDAAAVPLYNVTVTGALVGYVQHILFNETTQFASDLSGFRSSGLVEQ